MADQRSIEVIRNGSRPSTRGSEKTFTGSVIVDSLFAATEHTQATGGLVSFQPGARTAWHTHPSGQTLIVTSGIGWVQQAGGPRQHVQPGDVKRRYEAIAITKC